MLSNTSQVPAIPSLYQIYEESTDPQGRVIVKLAEYPALRAGMNAKRQLHENSRATALEIFAIKRKSRKQACEFS